MDGEIQKKLILVFPSTSHPIVRLGLRLFAKYPGVYSFFILSALTPKDYSIKIFNQKLFWSKRDFTGGCLVGISSITPSSCEAYKIADGFRKAGSVVVMGGPHVSFLPEEALKHCDSVVVGEAESVWPQVIKDYESGALKRIYQGTPLDDCFSPSYEYFLNADTDVLYHTGILFSRGCKYHCEFCVHPFGKPRYMELEQAIKIIGRIREHIKLPFGLKPTFFFKDDNIFSDPVYAKRLFKEMIPLDLHWCASTSIDIAFDEEALRLAHASGCQRLFIGFETIYPERLQKTSVAHMHSTQDYFKAIARIKSHGIKIISGIIFGFDYYTHRDYLKLMWFLIRARLFFNTLTILTPFPGSPLYARLKKEDRITTFDWRKYDAMYNIVFKPKHMSARSLYLWYSATRFLAICVSQYSLISIILSLGLYFIFFYLTYHWIRLF